MRHYYHLNQGTGFESFVHVASLKSKLIKIGTSSKRNFISFFAKPLIAKPQARCPPEKPANANTMQKISANKTTGNFQVDAGPAGPHSCSLSLRTKTHKWMGKQWFQIQYMLPLN